jgi:hypothetical protein
MMLLVGKEEKKIERTKEEEKNITCNENKQI